MLNIQYTFKKFDELTNRELYQIMRLRQEIFIVEQDCAYLDADDKDYLAVHVLGRDDEGNVHAYTRLLPKGISYPEYASIGRVVNSSQIRGQGVGKTLMDVSIQKIKELYPTIPVKIGAQAYLKAFYENLGFIDLGVPYLEDGIPHLEMILG